MLIYCSSFEVYKTKILKIVRIGLFVLDLCAFNSHSRFGFVVKWRTVPVMTSSVIPLLLLSFSNSFSYSNV
jgi:hypothetical protein